jgi:ankyrin repeat protein
MRRGIQVCEVFSLIAVLVGCGVGSDAANDPLFQNADDIYQAAAAGDLERTQYFMRMSSWDHNVPNYEGMLPLTAAAKGGNPEIIRLIVQEGADVNQPDLNRRTPLQYAESAGHTEAAALLRSLGARQ